jgi:hypothetical protein
VPAALTPSPAETAPPESANKASPEPPQSGEVVQLDRFRKK